MDWKESLHVQSKVILSVLNNSDLCNKIDTLVGELRDRKQQIIYFTGVGKNGFVAAKVASTFNSLGVKSIFLNPVDTLHGEMGVFEPESVIIFISKSGETEELIALANALLRNSFKPRIILMTSEKDSPLFRLAGSVIEIPVKAEGDDLNMAPIASTLVYMALLSAIGVNLSSIQGFTKKEFVRLHPGGALGKTNL
jgi:arabinose-5-phosphate isomerase